MLRITSFNGKSLTNHFVKLLDYEVDPPHSLLGEY